MNGIGGAGTTDNNEDDNGDDNEGKIEYGCFQKNYNPSTEGKAVASKVIME